MFFYSFLWPCFSWKKNRKNITGYVHLFMCVEERLIKYIKMHTSQFINKSIDWKYQVKIQLIILCKAKDLLIHLHIYYCIVTCLKNYFNFVLMFLFLFFPKWIPALKYLSIFISQILALKADRKRLKAEKLELLNQMKQLYGALEEKETELREFIRKYEQRMAENDESIKKVSKARIHCFSFILFEGVSRNRHWLIRYKVMIILTVCLRRCIW